jgi:hypothetical protein
MPVSLDAHHETRKLQREETAALAEAEALTVWMSALFQLHLILDLSNLAAPHLMSHIFRLPEAHRSIDAGSRRQRADRPEKHRRVSRIPAESQSLFHQLSPQSLASQSRVEEQPAKLSLGLREFYNGSAAHDSLLFFHDPDALLRASAQGKLGQWNGHVRIEGMVPALQGCIKNGVQVGDTCDVDERMCTACFLPHRRVSYLSIN